MKKFINPNTEITIISTSAQTGKLVRKSQKIKNIGAINPTNIYIRIIRKVLFFILLFFPLSILITNFLEDKTDITEKTATIILTIPWIASFVAICVIQLLINSKKLFITKHLCD